MTSPADMDKPAIVLTCLLGVLLIGLSGLLFYVTDEDPSDYAVTWAQVAAPGGEKDASIAEDAPGAVTVPVVDRLTSNVTVTMECADTRGPNNVAPAAAVTWTLRRGTEQIGSGSTACADNANVDMVSIEPHPDVGSVSANSEELAKTKVWASASNETAEYVLEFTCSRPAGQIPGVIPITTTCAGRMGLLVQEWTATINKSDAEATR